MRYLGILDLITLHDSLAVARQRYTSSLYAALAECAVFGRSCMLCVVCWEDEREGLQHNDKDR